MRSWFVTWLTGGAPVPTIRVGDQPYGILPVMTRADVDHSTLTKQRIADFIDVLIEEWRHAVASVPSSTTTPPTPCGRRPAGRAALADADARDLVTSVLANNPHPRRVSLRSASDWSDQPRPVFEFPGRVAAGR